MAVRDALNAVGVSTESLVRRNTECFTAPPLPALHHGYNGHTNRGCGQRCHLSRASSGTTLLSFAGVPLKSSLIPGGEWWVRLAWAVPHQPGFSPNPLHFLHFNFADDKKTQLPVTGRPWELPPGQRAFVKSLQEAPRELFSAARVAESNSQALK